MKNLNAKYWPWCDHLDQSTSCQASNLYEWHLKNANTPKQEPEGNKRTYLYCSWESFTETDICRQSKTSKDINMSLQLLQYIYGPCLHPSSLDFSTKSKDLRRLNTPWPNKDFPCMWRSRKIGPVHHKITYTLEVYIYMQINA